MSCCLFTSHIPIGPSGVHGEPIGASRLPLRLRMMTSSHTSRVVSPMRPSELASSSLAWPIPSHHQAHVGRIVRRDQGGDAGDGRDSPIIFYFPVHPSHCPCPCQFVDSFEHPHERCSNTGLATHRSVVGENLVCPSSHTPLPLHQAVTDLTFIGDPVHHPSQGPSSRGLIPTRGPHGGRAAAPLRTRTLGLHLPSGPSRTLPPA